MSEKKNRTEDAQYNDIIKKLRKEPELRNPEALTDNIMKKINGSNKLISFDRTVRVSRRILAAASISLLIVFGIEQYIFVDKVIQMEEKNAKVSEQNNRIKGLNFMIRNLDIEKIMLAEGEKNIASQDIGFIKTRLQKARILALNGQKIINMQNQ